jgi:hypothetical protein
VGRATNTKTQLSAHELAWRTKMRTQQLRGSPHVLGEAFVDETELGLHLCASSTAHKSGNEGRNVKKLTQRNRASAGSDVLSGRPGRRDAPRAARTRPAKQANGTAEHPIVASCGMEHHQMEGQSQHAKRHAARATASTKSRPTQTRKRKQRAPRTTEKGSGLYQRNADRVENHHDHRCDQT